MQIKLPNGVVINDASEEMVRAIVGTSFTPMVSIAEKPTPKKQDATFEAVPEICKTIEGPHKKRLTNLFLILREINMAGRDIARRELAKRLSRYERFAEMRSLSFTITSLTCILYRLGLVEKYGRRVRIDPSVNATNDEELLAAMLGCGQLNEIAFVNNHRRPA